MQRTDEHYINMIKKLSGKKPLSLGNSSDASQNEVTVKEIISVYVIILAFKKSKIYGP